MRIGLGQIDTKWEDKDYNMMLCSKFIQQAKEKHVVLTIFPEMTLTGFSMNTEKIAEEITNSPTLDFFQKEARLHKMYLCFGLVAKNQGKAKNCSIILNPKGEILCNYSKIHPFSFGSETLYYEHGNTLAFCNVEDAHISPFICYDLRFPEIFQLCSNRSNMILVTANWPIQRRAHWITLLKARAVENQCFIVGVNRCGTADNTSYSGDSMVIDPYGTMITKPSPNEGLVTCDIDISQVDLYRSEFQLKQDRRPGFYSDLYQSM